MKKLGVSVVLTSALMLASCAPESASETRVSFYTDEETGCQYLVYDGLHTENVLPRMGQDGKQVCNK